MTHGQIGFVDACVTASLSNGGGQGISNVVAGFTKRPCATEYR